jgi:hypothetical protein
LTCFIDQVLPAAHMSHLSGPAEVEELGAGV